MSTEREARIKNFPGGYVVKLMEGERAVCGKPFPAFHAAADYARGWLQGEDSVALSFGDSGR